MSPKLKLTEAEFLGQILELAHLHGWRTAHFRPAKTAHGWRTAVQGDGKGFPDLILLRGDRLIAWEVKVPYNKPTVEQAEWIRAFQQITPAAGVIYPADWEMIERTLASEQKEQ